MTGRDRIEGYRLADSTDMTWVEALRGDTEDHQSGLLDPDILASRRAVIVPGWDTEKLLTKDPSAIGEIESLLAQDGSASEESPLLSARIKTAAFRVVRHHNRYQDVSRVLVYFESDELAKDRQSFLSAAEWLYPNTVGTKSYEPGMKLGVLPNHQANAEVNRIRRLLLQQQIAVPLGGFVIGQKPPRSSREAAPRSS